MNNNISRCPTENVNRMHWIWYLNSLLKLKSNTKSRHSALWLHRKTGIAIATWTIDVLDVSMYFMSESFQSLLVGEREFERTNSVCAEALVSIHSHQVNQTNKRIPEHLSIAIPCAFTSFRYRCTIRVWFLLHCSHQSHRFFFICLLLMLLFPYNGSCGWVGFFFVFASIAAPAQKKWLAHRVTNLVCTFGFIGETDFCWLVFGGTWARCFLFFILLTIFVRLSHVFLENIFKLHMYRHHSKTICKRFFTLWIALLANRWND